MVAPRRLPGTVLGLPAPRRAHAQRSDGVAALATRWAGVVAGGDERTSARLATLLRRFAAVCRAEPFWPQAAREVGAELLASGLCGNPVDVRAAPDLLPGTLALLRRDAPAALGLTVREEMRLAAALDELAAGFAAELRDRACDAEGPLPVLPPDPGPAQRGGTRDRHYRTLYSTVYAEGPLGIAIVGLDGRVHEVNPALRRMFRAPGSLDQPRPVVDFVHPDDAAALADRFRRLVRGEPATMRLEMRLVRPDAVVLWTRVAASLVRDAAGRRTHVIAVVEDLSERYRLRTRLEQAAFSDQLTELPNRSMTEHRLELAFASGGAARVGLCALDLDGFTAVNDALGHHVGDRLLHAVAARLRLVAGEHLVTRTGGDEFAVIVLEPACVGDVLQLADRVLAALATPFRVHGHELDISASVGVAETPTREGRPRELMRAADVAMTWAKARGGGCRVVFDPERDAGESARFALLAGLRGGVENDEFRLRFQPLVRLADGRVQGVEALVRWQHPREGLLGPARFIELAERSGAIVPLGRWVLEAACRQAAEWGRELGGGAPYVSVNVSPVQLVEPGWVDEVTGVLADTGLPPDRLQLEITEKAVLEDEAAALRALVALRAAGVRLALDDFGTGYSNLAWLRRLPVHALKIDGSFIDGLRHRAADAVDLSIVRALTGMAHALELEVTAEWVESRAQAERLAELGCDLGQGRWFGDAGPASAVPDLWRRSISP